MYPQREKKTVWKKPRSCLVDSAGAIKHGGLVTGPSSGSCEAKITEKWEQVSGKPFAFPCFPGYLFTLKGRGRLLG